MNWTERVKELMKEAGINQKELSKRSGITEASVSRYLNGERKPRIDIVTNFARVFNVEVDCLLEDQEPLSDFESIKQAIARHGKTLTDEEQHQLIDLILGKD